MFFSASDIENIDEQRLRLFLELRVVERSQLDYKVQIVQKGKDDLDSKDKRNFLKDVTGFANANGGNIIYGAKEPAPGLLLDEQLVGVADAKGMASKLEALLRTGVDPRVYGVQVVPVPLTNGKSAIVLHVPPSQGRPHMVTLDGDKGFYIRHSESTVPMTTHEIKESVLLAASAEGRAKEYLAQQEKAVAELLTGRGPYLLFQAMPLIQPDQPLDVFTKAVKEVLRGDLRRNKYYDPAFSSSEPRPTIDGMEGTDFRDNREWVSEIHRNAYISCWLLNPKGSIDRNGAEAPVLTPIHKNAFMAFCELCRETLNALNLDLPYVMRCTQFQADHVYLSYEINLRYNQTAIEKPRQKKTLRWPDQIRQVGESFEPIASRWFVVMHHAYGVEMYDKPIKA